MDGWMKYLYEIYALQWTGTLSRMLTGLYAKLPGTDSRLPGDPAQHKLLEVNPTAYLVQNHRFKGSCIE